MLIFDNSILGTVRYWIKSQISSSVKRIPIFWASWCQRVSSQTLPEWVTWESGCVDTSWEGDYTQGRGLGGTFIQVLTNKHKYVQKKDYCEE